MCLLTDIKCYIMSARVWKICKCEVMKTHKYLDEVANSNSNSNSNSNVFYIQALVPLKQCSSAPYLYHISFISQRCLTRYTHSYLDLYLKR